MIKINLASKDSKVRGEKVGKVRAYRNKLEQAFKVAKPLIMKFCKAIGYDPSKRKTARKQLAGLAMIEGSGYEQIQQNGGHFWGGAPVITFDENNKPVMKMANQNFQTPKQKFISKWLEEKMEEEEQK